MTNRILAFLFLLFALFTLPPAEANNPTGTADGLQHSSAAQTTAKQQLGGNVATNLYEQHLEQLGITLAPHKPGTFPATISKVQLGSSAYLNGMQKDDSITAIAEDGPITSVTIKRAGKSYCAQLSQERFVPKAYHIFTPPKQASVTDEPMARRPMDIYIRTGGSNITDSFNTRATLSDLLTQLADLLSACIANSSLPEGAIPCSIEMSDTGNSLISGSFNGREAKDFFSTFAFTIDYRRKEGGWTKATAYYFDLTHKPVPRIDSPSLELTPLQIEVELGGRISDSFNNNAGTNNNSGTSLLDLLATSNDERIVIPGARLAEQVNDVLRPTTITYRVSSAELKDSFNAVGTFRNSNVRGTITAVPPTPEGESHRSINIHLNLPATIRNSFNNCGSLTVLINQFLNRLTTHMNPYALGTVDRIDVNMGGKNISASFNSD